MGREISIFSDYHQKENSLTNYCGLLMKLLYQDSPRKFEELLAAIVKTEADLIVGPIFEQQIKREKSIPDLAITQKSFSVFFETKRSDWFYDDQIKRHFQSFDQITKEKVLILLSNFEQDDLIEHFKKNIEDARKHNIILQPLSFEDLIAALEAVCDSEYLKNLLNEFKTYLDRGEYLPRWRYLLDVVNCAQSMDEIADNVYITADIGGAYSHRRAKYFGPYSLKKVRTIYEIKALVRIEKNLSAGSVKWKNIKEEDKNLIVEAQKKLRNWPRKVAENVSVPLQVFLLQNGVATDFTKMTPGGMQQSKKYFWDIATNCRNSRSLAEKLNGKIWGDFE